MNEQREMERIKACQVRDRYIRIYGEDAFWNRTMKKMAVIFEENKDVFMRLKDK